MSRQNPLHPPALITGELESLQCSTYITLPFTHSTHNALVVCA